MPIREKGSSSEINKKQKRLHKPPTRYGFEDSEDEESVHIHQEVSHDSLSHIETRFKTMHQ